MQERNNDTPRQGQHQNPLPQEISQQQKAQTEAAHEEAMDDIAADPELSAHSPNDDLDEGETARLGEGKNDLV